MKILILMAHASPWSLDIAESLRAQGHEIHVFDFDTLAPGGMPTSLNDAHAILARFASVQLCPRPRSSLGQHFALVWPLRRAIRRILPDVVLSMYAGRFALAAYLSGFRPYVTYVVGSDVLLAGRFQRLANRVVLGSSALVLSNGEYLAQRAREQAPGAKVENLLIGVDTKSLQPVSRSGIARLFNHRGFSPAYNNETIIRALAQLPDDVPPFEMTFASAGPQLEQAEALANQLLPERLKSAVKFLRGKLHRKQLMAALAHADVYLSITRSDGTATSVLEAMSCGVFPVLSDIPANAPLVDPLNGIGTLVHPDDPAALAAEIATRIRGVEQCRALAPTIRAFIVPIADSSNSRSVLAQRLESVAAEQSQG